MSITCSPHVFLRSVSFSLHPEARLCRNGNSSCTFSQANFLKSLNSQFLGNYIYSPSISDPISRQKITMTSHATNSSPESRSATKVFKFPGLKADEFRHPLDRQNTALLNMLPGISELASFFLGPLTEQLILEAIGNSVLVGDKQLKKLHSMMVESAAILDMPAPDLYVRQSPIPNAMAVYGNKPFVVINTAIVELMSPEELKAVIAHELGHLKCDHGIWLNVANIITLGLYSLPGIGWFLFRNLQDQIMRWFRSAELSCDRAALLVSQDPKVVISMLMKVSGGSPSLADDLNVDAFLQQARAYESLSNQSTFSRYYRTAQTRQLTHPLPVFRALAIDQWSASEEYSKLMKRGK